MRKQVSVILLFILSSYANGACEQSDLEGRWEFFTNSTSCRFIIDEEGNIETGGCRKHVAAAGYGPYLSESRPEKPNGTVLINRACRVTGYMSLPKRAEEYHFGIGRLNVDKSVVAGLAATASFEEEELVFSNATYTMVRF